MSGHPGGFSGKSVARTMKKTAALFLAVFLLAMAQRAGAGGPKDDNGVLLCRALQKVDEAARPSPTQRYEDIYNGYSKALSEADRYYTKILERGPRAGEGALLSIFDYYQEAATFWRAYMNDRVFVKRRDKTWEPSYPVDSNPWPAWLEERFPGLIRAVEEKGEKGYFITGDKALSYIFKQLGELVWELSCQGSYSECPALNAALPFAGLRKA